MQFLEVLLGDESDLLVVLHRFLKYFLRVVRRVTVLPFIGENACCL